MAELFSWLVTVVVVLASATFVLHVASVWRQPLERPRVQRRDRFGEPLHDDENPGPEIQGDDDEDAGDEAVDDGAHGDPDVRRPDERRRPGVPQPEAGGLRHRQTAADRAHRGA